MASPSAQVDDFIEQLEKAGMLDHFQVKIDTGMGLSLYLTFGEFKEFATRGRIW